MIKCFVVIYEACNLCSVFVCLSASPNYVSRMWHSCLPELVSTTFLRIVVVLPQVCNVWFGACKVILPVKHLVPKIIMAVNYVKGLVGQEEKLCDEVEAVGELTYLAGMVSAGGGCEAAVTARTRCGLVEFMEYGELLYGMKFPLLLKQTVYRSYVGPAILYGSEALCMTESEMEILERTRGCMVRGICGVQVKDRKKSKYLMLMLGLNETIYQLVNSDCWYGYMLRREDGHVLRRALCFEFEGQRKKGRLKRTWNKQIEEESVKVGLRRECALYRSKWSVGVNQIAAGCGDSGHPHLLGYCLI